MEDEQVLSESSAPGKAVKGAAAVEIPRAKRRGVREAPEPVQLQTRNGVSECPAAINPRPIPWVVYPAVASLLAGHMLLLGRLVFGTNSGGWPESGLLALHTVGWIVILASYLGKTTKLGGLSTLKAK